MQRQSQWKCVKRKVKRIKDTLKYSCDFCKVTREQEAKMLLVVNDKFWKKVP